MYKHKVEYWNKFDGDKKCFAVYVLQLSNGFFYVGCTNDLAQRLNAHWRGYGAMITRKYHPVKFTHCEWYESRIRALDRESELRRQYLRSQ